MPFSPAWPTARPFSWASLQSVLDALVSFLNGVESTAVNAETSSRSAVTTATNAQTAAAAAAADAFSALSQIAGKYTKPTTGIPSADLSAAVVAALATAPGTPSNPVTDPVAARPNLPVVYWQTYPTRPASAQPQDMIDARFSAAVATPAQITGLTSSAVSSTAFTLSWAGEANSSTYRVEVRPQGVATWTLTTTTSTSLTLTGRTASTTYEARVTGVNSAGTAGPVSATITVTTSAPVSTTTVYSTSYETSMTWQGSGATLARTTERASAGTYSLKITSTAAPYNVASPKFAVTAGQTYTATIRVSNGMPTERQVNAQILYYDAANVFLGVGSAPITVASGTGFSSVSVSLPAPAGATQAEVWAKADFGATVGDVIYIDDITVVG